MSLIRGLWFPTVAAIMVLLTLAPAFVQGLDDGFLNIRLYASFLETHDRSTSWSMRALLNVAVTASGPWRSAYGGSMGMVVFGLLVPAWALAVRTRGWQSQESLLFALVACVPLTFIFGFSNYTGMLRDYYLVMLSPLPFVFVAAVPAILPKGLARTIGTIALSVVAFAAVPSHLRFQGQYLTDRPEPLTHYRETLEIVARIAEDAGGRRFGVHFQDNGYIDSHNYLYHFGTLSRQRDIPLEAVRIRGLQLEPLNYFIKRQGEELLFKIAPGESRRIPNQSFRSTHLFDLDGYEISRVQVVGPSDAFDIDGYGISRVQSGQPADAAP